MSKTINISFKNSLNQTIDARLDLPKDSEVIAFAIYAHCFSCGKNIAAASRISKNLASLGIACLRFDFNGVGDSEGRFEDSNFSSYVEDVKAAAKYLTENHQAPRLLIGHSFGGVTVLEASKCINCIKLVVTIASPATPQHLLNHFKNQIEQIKKDGSAKVNILGKELVITKQFVEDAEKQDVLNGLNKQDVSYLILHSPFDKTVGIENAAQIYQALKHPKSFISLDYADHLISSKEDAYYCADMIFHLTKRALNKLKQSKVSSNMD